MGFELFWEHGHDINTLFVRVLAITQSIGISTCCTASYAYQ